MPFSLDVPNEEQFEIKLLQNEFEILAIVRIGHDTELDTIYSAHVALIQQSSSDSSYIAELLFDIVESIDDCVNYIDNGLETKDFLTGADRDAVLEIICSTAVKISSTKKPDTIVMTTSQSNLPNKALVKYYRIGQALRHAGFEGGEGNTFEGQHIWMFVKR